MKTRCRWTGPLPAVGDFLRTTRSVYQITGVGKAGERDAYDIASVTLEIERFPEKGLALCLGPLTVHSFRWSSRAPKRRS